MYIRASLSNSIIFTEKSFPTLVHLLKDCHKNKVFFFPFQIYGLCLRRVIQSNPVAPQAKINRLNTQSKNLPFGRRFKLCQNHNGLNKLNIGSGILNNMARKIISQKIRHHLQID